MAAMNTPAPSARPDQSPISRDQLAWLEQQADHLQVIGLLLKPGELIAADRGLIRSGGRCGCIHGGHGMTLCQHVKAQELREVACGALRKVPSPGPLSLGNRGAYNCRLIYLASVPTECPKP